MVLNQRVPDLSCPFCKANLISLFEMYPHEVFTITSPGSTHVKGACCYKPLNISDKKDPGGVVYSHACLGMLDLIPNLKAWWVSVVPQGYNHRPGKFSK